MLAPTLPVDPLATAEKPSEMARRIDRDFAAKLEQLRAAGVQDAAELAFGALMAQEFSRPRPGVKPWRYLSCGCRTDGGFPCVQHDLTLAEFWQRNKVTITK